MGLFAICFIGIFILMFLVSAIAPSGSDLQYYSGILLFPASITGGLIVSSVIDYYGWA